MAKIESYYRVTCECHICTDERQQPISVKRWASSYQELADRLKAEGWHAEEYSTMPEFDPSNPDYFYLACPEYKEWLHG